MVTVGRSDAIERSLPLHRDLDPVRVMSARLAEPIRASSPPGLHQQAGHMTASDDCASPITIPCRARAIHTCPAARPRALPPALHRDHAMHGPQFAQLRRVRQGSVYIASGSRPAAAGVPSQSAQGPIARSEIGARLPEEDPPAFHNDSAPPSLRSATPRA